MIPIWASLPAFFSRLFVNNLKTMKEKIYKHIPNLLRKHRKVRGLKQSEVAKLLGHKSASRISRWEKGVCIPSLVNVLRLSVLYRVMVDALFADHLHLVREEVRDSEEKIFGNNNNG